MYGFGCEKLSLSEPSCDPTHKPEHMMQCYAEIKLQNLLYIYNLDMSDKQCAKYIHIIYIFVIPDNLNFVQRLELVSKLNVHSGCVSIWHFTCEVPYKEYGICILQNK